MQLNGIQKFALGLSGITGLGIGLFIALAPHAFYASYGIVLGQDPNLLSELRAPGAGLAVLGAIIFAGILRAAIAPASLAAALSVYVAFPVGRILGIVLDGMPANSIIGALAVELIIAGLLLVAFRPWRTIPFRQDRLGDVPV